MPQAKQVNSENGGQPATVKLTTWQKLQQGVFHFMVSLLLILGFVSDTRPSADSSLEVNHH